jgi:hypothetical protein
MAVKALFALDSDTIFIQKDGEDGLYRWENDGSTEGACFRVQTPDGIDAWIESERMLHGLKRVLGENGKASPRVSTPPIFPTLAKKRLSTGEEVYIIERRLDEDADVAGGFRLDPTLLLAASAGAASGLLWGAFFGFSATLGWLVNAGLALAYLSVGVILAVIAVAGFRLITGSDQEES